MAKKADAPKATLEDDRMKIILDQDGVFLRAEMDDKPLVEGEHYDIYEEVLEKEEKPSDPGTPPENEVVAGSSCPECGGSGLKDKDTRCDVCEGSGKVA